MQDPPCTGSEACAQHGEQQLLSEQREDWKCSIFSIKGEIWEL